MTISQTIVFRGTSDVQLEVKDGAFQEFLSSVGSGIEFEYWIKSRNGGALIESNSGQWENGLGELSPTGLLQRTSVIDGSLGAGVLVPFNLDANTVFLIGGSTPGSSNAVLVTVSFGSSFSHIAQTVVTGQSWVTLTSRIVATPLAEAGKDVETAVLSLQPSISDLVAGVGFTLTVFAPYLAKRDYTFSCVGV